ncbi:DUF397 domain-containing protein [Streptomyces sp. NEAU-sy36]|uniref:DUF397 domain-containing protein n=1 Tax=unclassified Streptomyces TaxID=2593676 RepID=UPI0015D57ADF|nr:MULTISPECIES: DUF397 domain-containing protein [unclassified Streptomyces]QLJ00506.1 DUF397 domain-containing protein [Streptomyces sp. NEAU-sy36]
MRKHDLSNARWRKSSYSSGDSSNECLEVADGVPHVVPVRDSKLTGGPVLLIGPDAWARFVGSVTGQN